MKKSELKALIREVVEEAKAKEKSLHDRFLEKETPIFYIIQKGHPIHGQWEYLTSVNSLEDAKKEKEDRTKYEIMPHWDRHPGIQKGVKNPGDFFRILKCKVVG